jgi:hypothetical protein
VATKRHEKTRKIAAQNFLAVCEQTGLLQRSDLTLEESTGCSVVEDELLRVEERPEQVVQKLFLFFFVLR